MAWTPTKAIITARAIPQNLLTWVTDADRQADALTWAGGQGYKAIKTFSQSVANRTVPVYPAIAFSDDNDLQDFGDDLIAGGYSCVLEVSIQNANPDTAVTQARIYAEAIVSMIVNCTTLSTDTGADLVTIQQIEVGFEQIKSNEKQNDFLQQFQIRVTCTMHASMYE